MRFLISSLMICSLFAQEMEEDFFSTEEIISSIEKDLSSEDWQEEAISFEEVLPFISPSDFQRENLIDLMESTSYEETKGLLPEVKATYTESLYSSHGQSFSIDTLLHEEKSDWWNLMIFENRFFGKVLAIDGTIQLTEKDEPIYHEMMAHVPLLSHDNPKSVLIIGGGDGGLLREVTRHRNLETIKLVEIDPRVIELSKNFMPNVSRGSFNDPRVEVIIQDACLYLKETQEQFDVILCDATDPIGAGAVLFTKEFYGDCKKCLKPEGIFVNQNGVPFVQPEEIVLTMKNRSPHFQYVSYYSASVPTYAGGIMTLGWASDKNYRPSLTKLRRKRSLIDGKMVYYTPEIHKASFALPQFVIDIQQEALKAL